MCNPTFCFKLVWDIIIWTLYRKTFQYHAIKVNGCCLHLLFIFLALSKPKILTWMIQLIHHSYVTCKEMYYVDWLQNYIHHNLWFISKVMSMDKCSEMKWRQLHFAPGSWWRWECCHNYHSLTSRFWQHPQHNQS